MNTPLLGIGIVTGVVILSLLGLIIRSLMRKREFDKVIRDSIKRDSKN